MRSQDVITEKQREIRKADLQHQEEKRTIKENIFPMVGKTEETHVFPIVRKKNGTFRKKNT
jgi:hypothetical protein